MPSSNPVPRPITLSEFKPIVGQTMLVDCDPRTAELLLVEAKPLRQRPDTERLAFSLLFRSKSTILLVAGSYAMRCGEFGPELIFITPVSAPVGSQPGHYYEAIFN